MPDHIHNFRSQQELMAHLLDEQTGHGWRAAGDLDDALGSLLVETLRMHVLLHDNPRLILLCLPADAGLTPPALHKLAEELQKAVVGNLRDATTAF